MKKLVACVGFACLALASCHKKTSTSCSNTVTVKDDTGIYSACGNSPNGVKVVLYGIDTNYYVEIVAGGHYPYGINITGVQPLLSGTGPYTLRLQDSGLNVYTENFSGGQSYHCLGGNISVNSADSANVSGTFSITVYNRSGSKMISGTFNANQPVVEY